MEIVVTRRTMLISRSSLRPFTSLYEATGPNGKRFTNTSIAELRSVMKKNYGMCTFTVVNG